MEKMIIRVGADNLHLEGTPEQLRRVRRTIDGWKERLVVDVRPVGRPVGSVVVDREASAEIREWARSVGVVVGSRGSLREDVVEAWAAAMLG